MRAWLVVAALAAWGATAAARQGGYPAPGDGEYVARNFRFATGEVLPEVRLQHLLVTEGLGLTHLRLIMGTSMGAMHTWMWGRGHGTHSLPAVWGGELRRFLVALP